MGRKWLSWRERYQVSKKITGQSFRLIASMRSYWVFPLAAGAVMTVFITTIFLATMLSAETPQGDRTFLGIENLYLVAAVVLVILYGLLVFVSLMNATLALGAYRQLEGRPLSPRDALRRSLSQIGPIIRFTFIAFLVGLFIAAIGQFLDKLKIIPGVAQLTHIIGALAWTAASFFVIPILVVEREGRVKDALKGSVALARENWGKSVSGVVTIKLAIMVPTLIVVLLAMVVAFPLAIVLMESQPATLSGFEEGQRLWFIVMTAFMAFVMLVVGISTTLGEAVQSVYQAGLYSFTKSGDIGRPFTQETLQDAWEPYRSS